MFNARKLQHFLHHKASLQNLSPITSTECFEFFDDITVKSRTTTLNQMTNLLKVGAVTTTILPIFEAQALTDYFSSQVELSTTTRDPLFRKNLLQGITKTIIALLSGVNIFLSASNYKVITGVKVTCAGR
jgi:hypothetical protein